MRCATAGESAVFQQTISLTLCEIELDECTTDKASSICLSATRLSMKKAVGGFDLMNASGAARAHAALQGAWVRRWCMAGKAGT